MSCRQVLARCCSGGPWCGGTGRTGADSAPAARRLPSPEKDRPHNSELEIIEIFSGHTVVSVVSHTWKS